MNISPCEQLPAVVEDSVGWITFNNPARRNAVTEEMSDALPVVLEKLSADPAVRVIAIRGAGEKAFAAGAELNQLDKLRNSEGGAERHNAMLRRTAECFEKLSKPTLAMIQGYCIGFGFSVALLCDLRVAGESARLQLPAARLGHGPSWNTIKRLIDFIGRPYTREIVLTGRQFTGVECAGMGLVHRVAPDSEVEALAKSYCDMLKANAPLSLQSAKATINAVGSDNEEAARAECERLIAVCTASEDNREGRRAVIEKRKPVFVGR